MGQYYTITMKTHRFTKMIEILETYTESLNNYFEIEDCVNLIHLIQEEIYKYEQQQKQQYVNYVDIELFVKWIYNTYLTDNEKVQNEFSLLEQYRDYIKEPKKD